MIQHITGRCKSKSIAIFEHVNMLFSIRSRACHDPRTFVILVGGLQFFPEWLDTERRAAVNASALHLRKQVLGRGASLNFVQVSHLAVFALPRPEENASSSVDTISILFDISSDAVAVLHLCDDIECKLLAKRSKKNKNKKKSKTKRT